MSKYNVKLILTRDMLGTNPCDPNILDVHILDRQRKLITQNRGINKSVNKYLDQLEITDEKAGIEREAILDKLENLIGRKLDAEDREKAIRGELEGLRESFAELDLKATTVFYWNKEKNLPCIGDHMIYGFLKASTEAIGRTLPSAKGKVLQSISYTQSLINQHVRCEQRLITFNKDIRRDEKGNPSYYQRSLRAQTAQGPRITLAKSEVVPEGAELNFVLKVMDNSPITFEVLKKLFDYGEFSGLGQWRNAGYGMFTYEIAEV